MAFEFYILPSQVSYKTSPELGSSQTASLFLTNAKQPPIEKRKRKKWPEYSLGGKGVGGLKGRVNVSEIQRKEGSGQQPFPHALCYACRVTEDRQRGGSALSSPPAPAQLLRDASCQLSHPLSCSGCSSGLRLGAIKLQC